MIKGGNEIKNKTIKKPIRLDEWIKAKGWTKKKFAEKFGVSQEAVRRWTLHNKIPMTPTLKRLQKFTKGAVTKESFEIETTESMR